MNLKKVIAKFLIGIMIAVLLSGCNNSNSAKETSVSHVTATITPTYSEQEQVKNLQALYDSSKTIDENIAVYLEEMTLEEKIGQMFQVERRAISVDEIKQYNIGSIFAAGGSAPDENTLNEWRIMTDRYRNAAKDTRLAIPIIFAVDAVHGNNNMKDTVIFPHNIGLGASGNSELIGEIAHVTANELIAAGIDWTFAPCVAVMNDIRWGRTYECFSENSDLVSIMSISYITELQKQGIITCAKHYVADGAVQFGSGDSGYLMDQGNANITQKELNDYISNYKEAVNAGVKSVMLSYSSIKNEKNHANKYLIQDILKNEIGFNGIVVTDYNGIHQLEGVGMYPKVVEAVNAGVDLLMEDSSWKECYEALIKAVENNDIRVDRIDDAVSRILRVKMETGKFNAKEETLMKDYTLRNAYNMQLSEKAVRESLVLLKNKKNILPLNRKDTIAVIGPAADNIGVQCGGWTKTWQGGQDDQAKGRWMSGTTVLDGFKEIASESGINIITDPNKLEEADVVVAVLGEYPYAEGKGDDATLSIVQGTVLEGNESTLKAAYKSKKPLVVILISGRPRIVTNEIDKWDSFIEAWLPGTEGGIIAKVLYGDYEFSGRLPVTWPKNHEQLPMTLNNKANGYNALYPYGYGLSINEK